MKKLIWIWGIFLLLSFEFTFAAEKRDPDPQVVLETSKGKIVIALYPEKAPATVENFLAYANSGFYNNTVFHRVIDGFMIQGGGFTSGMTQKPTRPPIQNEADNGLKNETGAIAMARTGNPHSATSQFFINTIDNPFLNHMGKTPEGWGYTVFGKVIEGMDVVDAISKTPTAASGYFQNVPVEPVLILKASIR